MTTLEHYAEINPSTAGIDRTSTAEVAFVPMAAVSEEGRLVTQETRSIAEVAKGYTTFARNDVLMAKITPCMENGKAALVNNLATEVGFGSTEFHVLRARPGVDARFLFYLVWNSRFRDEAAKHMTGSAGQKRVPASYLKQAKVPLVDPLEQQRIADILDKADAIRRKRKEAIALTEGLLRSAFLEMFGDPVTNPKGWPMKSLDELDAQFSYGTSTKCTDDDRGHAVLRIPNVVGGDIDFSDLKYADLEDTEAKRFSLAPGDLLFVRSNGNPNYIARAAVFKGGKHVLFASYLIRARLPDNCEVLPQFVHSVFSADAFRHQLLKEATTTAGNFNINTKGLGRQRVPLPPPILQKRFVATAERVHATRARHEHYSNETADLFDSLVARAFSGSLEVSC